MRSIHLSIHPSIHRPINPPIHPSIHQSIHSSIHPPTHPLTHSSKNPNTHNTLLYTSFTIVTSYLIPCTSTNKQHDYQSRLYPVQFARDHFHFHLHFHHRNTVLSTLMRTLYIYQKLALLVYSDQYLLLVSRVFVTVLSC